MLTVHARILVSATASMKQALSSPILKYNTLPERQSSPLPHAAPSIVPETSPNSTPEYNNGDVDNDSISSRSSSDSDSSQQDQEMQSSAWQIAHRETLEGLQYVMEKFPTEGVSYLSQQYAQEPLEVQEGDKVIILDDVSDFTLRVKVLHTDTIGLLPSWNIETPLERLARLNMMQNEIDTCPLEIEAQKQEHDPDSPQSPKSPHVHSRCQQQSRRMKVALIGSRENSPEDASPMTPSDESPFSRRLNSSRKSVNFRDAERKKIYRYIHPAFPPVGRPRPEPKDESDSDAEGSTEEPEDIPWWDGWEEPETLEDETASQLDITNIDEDSRPGRPRRRKRDMFRAFML